MKLLENAIEKDVAKEYFSATKIYEEVILQKNASIDGFINLSFIYWESNSQLVFTNGTAIENEFKKISLFRYLDILKLAIKKFPNNAELYFWLKYLPFAGMGESFTESECLNILRKYGDSQIPYFFLYLFDKKTYKIQRDKLLEECIKLPTAKNTWIKSIIEN